MSEHVEITVTDDDKLWRTTYRFWINYPAIALDSCFIERREVVGKKFSAGPRWNRLDKRSNTMLKPSVPAGVADQAKALAAEKLHFSNQWG